MREATRKKAIRSPNQLPVFEPHDNIVCSDIFSNLHSDAKEIEIQVLLQTKNLSEMKRFQIIFRSFHIQALYEKYKNAARLLHMQHKTIVLSIFLNTFFWPCSSARRTYAFIFRKTLASCCCTFFSHVTYYVCPGRQVFQKFCDSLGKFTAFVLMSWNPYFVKEYLNVFEEHFECAYTWLRHKRTICLG